MTAPKPKTFDLIQETCKKWLERREVQSYRTGTKAADAACLEFVCGAAVVAELCGSMDLARALRQLAWVTSVRGEAEVLSMTKRRPPPVEDQEAAPC